METRNTRMKLIYTGISVLIRLNPVIRGSILHAGIVSVLAFYLIALKMETRNTRIKLIYTGISVLIRLGSVIRVSFIVTQNGNTGYTDYTNFICDYQFHPCYPRFYPVQPPFLAFHP